jgi:voltage-gated potassium channel Kch
LNRKNPLPKGYKPHDEKPHIMRVYPERIMTSNICEALDKTFVGNNLIELIGYNTSSIEFLSYLGMLKWSERIQIVKFIGVHLTDENFNLTLCSIEKLRNVSTIVVSNNHLSDVSLEILLNFARQSQHIKTAYLGKNHINHFKSKAILQ